MAEERDLCEYRAGLPRMYEERAATFERERVELLERVRPGYFDRASDIDILIVGLPEVHTWRALRAIEEATGIYDRELNPVFAEMVSDSLAAEARKNGVPL